MIEIATSGPSFGADDKTRFLEGLEAGEIVHLSALPFMVAPEEAGLLDPAISDGHAKNVSFDPATGRCGGTSLAGAKLEELARLMARYAAWSENLVRTLAPRWSPGITVGRTSLRPSEIEGRGYSLRKDDTRLHVDSFRSQPVQGRRILRVFANVNPQGQPRVWYRGEPFPAFAGRFAPRIKSALPGGARLMQSLGITKGYRTAYDSAMLQLHDMAKEDEDYQKTAPREKVAFASGTTWFVFTDTVLHAVVGGSHAFEQTFLIDVAAMAAPEQSPLRILEKLTGRALV